MTESKKPDPTEVGARIRDLREIQSWSQPELAKRIDVSTGSIWRWEKGDRLPSSEDLSSLAQAFGVPMEQLLFGGSSGMPVSKSLAAYFSTADGSRL
jgi:transcriptional regulator with XRE-family HTH domain